MKAKFPLRYLLLLLFVISAAIVLQKAYSAKNHVGNDTKPKTCCAKPAESSNNDFIFFESFNRFLLINTLQ